MNYGIVVGNGYADVAIDNYALNSRMGSGNGAGQMGYPKMQKTAIDSGVSNARNFEMNRYFANLYVLPQIVRECGLYAKLQGSSIYFCFIRDLIGAIEIPPQGGISINYKVEIKV